MTDARFAEIEGHRPYLMRYALAQLRDGQLAEEAVQEALLAALESLGSFAGKSTLRTWLTSRGASGRRSRRASIGCLPRAGASSSSARSPATTRKQFVRKKASPRSTAGSSCERQLSASESEALTYHLDRCLMCRNFDSQLRFLHRAAERYRSGGG